MPYLHVNIVFDRRPRVDVHYSGHLILRDFIQSNVNRPAEFGKMSEMEISHSSFVLSLILTLSFQLDSSVILVQLFSASAFHIAVEHIDAILTECGTALIQIFIPEMAVFSKPSECRPLPQERG